MRMIGALLLFSALNFSNLVPKIDTANIAQSANASVPMDIAADSAFSQITQNFGSGQTVYVRITTDNEGSGKHSLIVHDSNYNILSTYSLSRSGSLFTASFPAPQSAGTYSLEADIESNGSVLSLVKTITVGGGGDGSEANVKVENRVNSDNQILGEVSGLKSAVPVSTPTAAAKIQRQNFLSLIWSGIAGFFRNLF